MEILLLIWIACGIAAMVIAGQKGRSGCGWAILGFLFGPLGLLAAAIISPDRQAMEQRAERAGLQSGKLRPCSRCAELIRPDAVLCRFCGSEVAPAGPKRTVFDDVMESIEERRRK